MKTNNELIADFYCESREIVSSIKKGKQYLMLGWWHDYDDLEFNTSWDWLIPVVEKIESIKWDNESQPDNGLLTWGDTPFSIQIEGFTTQVIVDNGSEDTKQPFTYFTHKDGNKLERTYKAVVEFIKWYNEQEK